MRIGIVGAGNVGTGLGKRLAARGNELVVSFSRSQEALDQAVTAIGGCARTGSVPGAVLRLTGIAWAPVSEPSSCTKPPRKERGEPPSSGIVGGP
jgi:hypothetical protein